MSNFLRRYLDIGLSDIVVISHEWDEEKGGYSDEHTEETIVAKKDGRPVKLSVNYHQHFSPYGGGSRFDEGTPELITAQEYKKLAAGKTVIDNPEALAAIAAEDNRVKMRQSVEQQISATAPKCHKCGRGMNRTNGKNGYFWSCQGFPKHCDGTANLSSAAKRLCEELKRL